MKILLPELGHYRRVESVREILHQSIVARMLGFLFTSLTLVLILAGSCSKQSPAPKAIQPPWSLQLTTSGGFVGRGRGNFAVSGGKFSCSQTNQQNGKANEGVLNARQQQPIIDALAQANPKNWNKPGLDVAAPDAYGYKLELWTGSDLKDGYTVKWYDNTRDQLPEDLKKLSEALLQTMNTSCGGVP